MPDPRSTPAVVPQRNVAALAGVYRRITLRVAPFLILLYFVAFLDRVNVSFASITMNRDLGIGEDVFGLAAGVFFVGYLLFSLPSNLMLVRFGARRWIAIIMVAWGLFSCSMAFIHSAPAYVGLRFLIGAAEAGFFPGVILYLTLWLPASVRAGLMAAFTLSIPLSNVVGAPLSAAILRLGGTASMQGWQWLFLLEGLPAVLLGCAVPFLLNEGPQGVSWLSPSEKTALASAIRGEENTPPPSPNKQRPLELAARLVLPSLTYFFLMIGLYALSFWVPRILHGRGVTLAALGWKTAIPFAFGALGMVIWSRFSDGSGNRRENLGSAFLLAAVGLSITAASRGSTFAIAGLSLTAIGVLAGMPIFWAGFSTGFPAATNAERAFAIAAVNSIGNLGGFLGPLVTGKLIARTHADRVGLFITAACLLAGAILALFTRGRPAATADRP